MKEIVIRETDLDHAFFSYKARLLLWPKCVPSDLQEQYIEYFSPPFLKEIAKVTAETVLYESVHATNVGLVGSLARNESQFFSDIDLVIFTRPDLVWRLVGQSHEVYIIRPTEDVYSLINIEKRKVEEALSWGKPVASEGISFENLDLHPILLPNECDPEFVKVYEKFNPRKIEGLSFLASLGKDLLIFNPKEKDFIREEDNWLVGLYEEEARRR